MRVHPKSIKKMKNHLRELTVRGNKWRQPGEGRETQEICDWVDQLLPVRRHEKPDGDHGRMASPQNPCGVLETMEESADEI